jgi:kumamolisin
MHHFSGARVGIAALLLAIASLGNAWAVAPATVVLADSIKPVATASSTATIRPSAAYISRQTLTSAESGAPMVCAVALKMRNFPELQARIARGERVSPAEMAEKYEPLPADYQAVADWLKGEGFTLVRNDAHPLAVFARGSVSQVAQALRVNFARVRLDDNEYTSAVTAPSVPAAISSLLVGINGLQPHLRAHKHLLKSQARPNVSGGGASYLPGQIAQAYAATGLYHANITGAGQAIAIVIDTFPIKSDLVSFWQAAGVNQSINNISFIQVISGTLATDSDSISETTLDTEWSSAMAPAAKVRVYAALDLESSDLDQAYEQVYTDATTQPQLGIHQMSMSYGEGEKYTTNSQAQTDDQYFAELAAVGVTCFASSGDGGATPGPGGAGDESGPLQVEAPASDPNVTGVGGTTLKLDGNNNESSEVVWNTSGGAGGGGSSVYFSRPTWQTGAGIPAGTQREVPDVAGPADPNYGAVVYIGGAKTTFGGTSWACPTWAAFCALINQARANVEMPPLGALNPRIYPLLGAPNYSTDIRDIVSGNNATANSGSTNGVANYTAGTGYDLASGLGVPLVQSLSQTLVGSLTQPQVQISLAFQDIVPGQNAMISVASSGNPVGYQWQRMPMGATTWSNLSDNAIYSGSATASLTINGATTAMSGDQFQCVVTFAGPSSVTSPSSALVIDTPLVISTLAGAAGTIGSHNASGTGATFAYPSGIAVDSSGNLYIADYNNNAIREVTPGGAVSTPYGSLAGTSGSTNASGNSALFDTPNGVAVDGSNNLYVADTGNNLIRKIVSGVVSTLAGSGGQFNLPEGVAVDGSGNVYVADTGNDTIDKISPGGVVSILAGQTKTAGYANGAGATQALFNGPSGVAVDGSGNVYVADFNNDVVRKITSAGLVSTIAGQAGVAGYLDGPGATAQFNTPSGIAIDGAGNLYVTDSLVPPIGSIAAGNDLVRRITPVGVVSTIAGQPGNEGMANGTGTAAQFYSVQAVALNATTGAVFLADTYNQTIRMGIPASIPPVITSANGATFIVGQPGSFTVTATGSPAPTFSASGLPAWASLNSQTGTLAGTPTQAGIYSGTITVSNGVSPNATQAFTLTVNQAPSITSAGFATFALGEPDAFTVTATGFPAPNLFTFSPTSGSLPSGLNFSAAGVFSGTPTQSGTFTGTITVSNGILPNATQNFTLNVEAAVSFTEWEQQPQPGFFTVGEAGNAGVGGPTATPENDGVPNLLKYLDNVDPNRPMAAADRAALPVVGTTTAGNTLYLTLTYRQYALATGLLVNLQTSPDLLTWTTVTPDLSQQVSTDSVTSDPIMEMGVILPANTTRKFIRLNVSQP